MTIKELQNKLSQFNPEDEVEIIAYTIDFGADAGAYISVKDKIILETEDN